jgi:leucyl/phenylalanyl-tRNA--protein transferase
MPEQPQQFVCQWQFHDPRSTDDEGFVGVGADMKPATLLYAYSHGLFPWTSDPITWWSPNPRAIFEWDSFVVSSRLERTLRQGKFRITCNQAFPQVMEKCAASAPGREKTWISGLFIASYVELHRLGYAHSLECWRGDELVGGVYGVGIGGFFAGESMFHTAPDAGKIALTALVRTLAQAGFALFDVQFPTPHLESLGVQLISRDDYLKRLKRAVRLPCRFPEEPRVLPVGDSVLRPRPR